jgi:hypothetical protein
MLSRVLFHGLTINRDPLFSFFAICRAIKSKLLSDMTDLALNDVLDKDCSFNLCNAGLSINLQKHAHCQLSGIPINFHI